MLLIFVDCQNGLQVVLFWPICGCASGLRDRCNQIWFNAISADTSTPRHYYSLIPDFFLLINPRSLLEQHVSNTRGMGPQSRSRNAEHSRCHREVPLRCNGLSPFRQCVHHFVAHILIGYGVSWRRCSTYRVFQDVIGLPLPNHAM